MKIMSFNLRFFDISYEILKLLPKYLVAIMSQKDVAGLTKLYIKINIKNKIKCIK